MIEGGGSAVRVTPSARSEVLALVQQACSAACDAVRVVVYGEEIIRAPASDASTLGERLIEHIRDDASTREHGRHGYHLHGMRGDSVAFSTVVRLTGGGASSGSTSIEPTTAGTLKAVLRHQESLAGLLVKSHAVTLDSMGRELERTRERCELLEDQNDKLRSELRQALEGGKADAARAEQERARTELIIHTGRQLLRYLPHVLKTWFPIGEAEGESDDGEKGKPKPAPSGIVSALAGVTDEQLERAASVLTTAQREIIGRARAGAAVSVLDVVKLADELTDEATDTLARVLRPDQMVALVDAMSLVEIAKKEEKE